MQGIKIIPRGAPLVGMSAVRFVGRPLLEPGPQLVLSNPPFGATSVAITSNIVLTFNRDILAVQSAVLYIDIGGVLTPVETFISQGVTIVANQITFNPTDDFLNDSDYTLVIPFGSITALGGASYEGGSVSFTTILAAPALLSSTPAEGSTTLAIDSDLTLIFDQLVSRGSGTMTLDRNNGGWATIQSFTTATAASATQTYNPTSDLVNSGVYRLVIPSGFFVGPTGVVYPGVTISFEAVALPVPIAADVTLEYSVPEGTAPTVSSTSPANGATLVSTSTNPTVTLSRTGALGASGNFYLYNVTNSAIITTFDVSDPGTGPGQVSISGAVITLHRDGALPTGKNIAIRWDAGAYTNLGGAPSGAITGNTYAFTTVATPAFASATPADNATGVATATSTLAITFDQTLLSLGLTGNFTLRNVSGSSDVEVFDLATEVGTSPGQVSFSGAVVTLHLTSALANGTNYSVRWTAGAVIAASGACSAVTDDTTYNFTSILALPAYASSSPTDGSTTAAVSGNITITFDKTVTLGASGSFTIRNVTGSSDTEVFDLATEVGTGTGQVSVSGDTVTLHPTADRATGTAYSIRWTAGAVLNADAVAVAVNSGDTLMNFSTEAAPAYSSSSPADNATGVAVNAAVTITFDRNVSFGASGNFTLRNVTDSSDFEVFDVTDIGTGAGEVSVSGATVTLHKTTDFTGSKVYSVRFSAGAVVNAGGGPCAALTNDTTMNFTIVSTGSVSYVQSKVVHSTSTTGTSFTSGIALTSTLAANRMTLIACALETGANAADLSHVYASMGVAARTLGTGTAMTKVLDTFPTNKRPRVIWFALVGQASGDDYLAMNFLDAADAGVNIVAKRVWAWELSGATQTIGNIVTDAETITSVGTAFGAAMSLSATLDGYLLAAMSIESAGGVTSSAVTEAGYTIRDQTDTGANTAQSDIHPAFMDAAAGAAGTKTCNPTWTGSNLAAGSMLMVPAA